MQLEKFCWYLLITYVSAISSSLQQKTLISKSLKANWNVIFALINIQYRFRLKQTFTDIEKLLERNVKNVANSLSFFFAEKLKKINKNKVRIFFVSFLTKKKGNAENENLILWSKVAIGYSNSKFLIFKFLFWNILKRFRNSNMYTANVLSAKSTDECLRTKSESKKQWF